MGGGWLHIGIRAWLRFPWVNVFVMHSWQLYMCQSSLWSMCLLHMHGVGHGRSDVTMGIRMLCEECCHECMTGYMLLYVAYMCHFVCLVTFSYVWVNFFMVGYMYDSCRFGCKYRRSFLNTFVHMCVWYITHFLCMLMFSCRQVYNGVMVVVFMHAVIACV